MSTGVIIAIVLPLSLVGLAGLTLGIIALCSGVRRMFLRDPNHEPAKAAPAPEHVGRRETVSETSRGDYHRETVESSEAIVASELSRAQRISALYEMFTARAAPATPRPPAPHPGIPQPGALGDLLGRVEVVIRSGEPPAAAAAKPSSEPKTAPKTPAKPAGDKAGEAAEAAAKK